MWSTKCPKPIMLPLQIHSQSPGQNPPPTVQPWRDCWCPSPGRTPTPQATLILILKGKRRWQMNHQKSSPIKSRWENQTRGDQENREAEPKTEMAREEQGTSTSPHLVNPINQRKKEKKKKRKRDRERERERTKKKNRDDTEIKTRKKIKRKERGREERTGSWESKT